VELIDLLRPTGSAVSAAAACPKESTDGDLPSMIGQFSASLAIEAVTAQRDSVSGGLSYRSGSAVLCAE